jgi:predicted dienelactone hydrolase
MAAASFDSIDAQILAELQPDARQLGVTAVRPTTRVLLACLGTLLGGFVLATAAFAGAAPSQFGIDAPELARPGAFGVGVKTLHLVQGGQVDVLAFDAASGTFSKKDRVLAVDLWYPARIAPGAAPETYTASLPGEPPAAPFEFSVPGIAVRDAPAAGTGFPLVIVSHGRSNATYAMTWLTENLASKGYVVAAIRHADRDYTDPPSQMAQIVQRRPLDIAYVAKTLQATLGAQHLIDPARTALIGYSMGGYGVLTAAGATLDPESPVMTKIPGGLMRSYARGADQSAMLKVDSVRAVVALSPYGGGLPAVWGAEGLLGITAPLLLISGDDDHSVNYVTGARAFFDAAANSQRYLLTFKGAGHAIGLNPAPEAKPRSMWDLDWFEDPVWKKERILAINAHFITAFLDRYVKGDETRSAYLDVATSDSSGGVWPSVSRLPRDSFSPGADGVTVWKGFQRNRADGLQLLRAGPVSGAAPR